MSDWLSGWRKCDDPVADALVTSTVLVTVAATRGSVPRAPGTKMLVGPGYQFGTVGGGHLEMRALQIARALLAGASQGKTIATCIERFALGPSLGQCCGGAVHLVFEHCSGQLAAVLDGLQQRRRQHSWRCSAIDGDASAALFDDAAVLLAGLDFPDPAVPALTCITQGSAGLAAGAGAGTGTYIDCDDTGRRWLIDPCPAPRSHLMLFGAGHVGSALIKALAAIDCHVTWVDQREDQFPSTLPSNVTIEITDTPQALVAQALPGSSFLVMTHSHALDFSLIEAITLRGDAAWFGLIGSNTKRRQFEHRLQQRGVAEAQIAALVCPIGLPGITGKEPAVIAASVCCQLLMAWQTPWQAPGQEHT
jgi:xanthine dehydrogenase accessory factor